MEPKPVAAVITEWRKNSHADVILGRLLDPQAWGHTVPFGLRLAAVYADQFPDSGDLCRPLCAKYGVPVFTTIREAIGLGSARVAVQGVLLIGEHGAYPINSRGQWLYPRRRLFEGETTSDTLAAVLKAEPDWERIPAKAQRLLKSCLEKDPKRRLRDIADAWRLLEDAPVEPFRATRIAWVQRHGYCWVPRQCCESCCWC